MHQNYDFVIIGAGIIGLATAHRLGEERRGARIAVVEQETVVAAHQSGHSSGVVHAGVYYPPGSLKAEYCRRGADAMLAFCAAHGVSARRCGKLIVATAVEETERLLTLAARAESNGLECTWVDADELRDREPNVRGTAALYVPATGIADYAAVCRKLAELCVAQGCDFSFGQRVCAIGENGQGAIVETPTRTLTAAQLIVCGGLQADRLARMAGLDIDAVVVPFRGDYFRLPAARAGLVSTLIYPVPDPRLPFLGVHLTLTADGGLTLGPSAMLAFARERYEKWAFERRDFIEIARHPGTWRLLAQFPRAGAMELAHCMSRARYLEAARRYCPQLTIDDLGVHACGIRAQLVDRRGTMINDFLIEQTPHTLHVLNAPSPAATSAFPIAAEIVARIDKGAG